MTTLEKRLDQLERSIAPKDDELYCVVYLYENGHPEGGSKLCPHGLVKPSIEICEACNAHKIFFKLVD